jgi:hypothetical protein
MTYPRPVVSRSGSDASTSDSHGNNALRVAPGFPRFSSLALSHPLSTVPRPANAAALPRYEGAATSAAGALDAVSKVLLPLPFHEL